MPRACGSQCGTPSPVNAGTRTTPPESGTEAASGSTSSVELIRPSPSRSQRTTAPPVNTLPSRAYRACPSVEQAIVVSSPRSDGCGADPVWSSAKQPVP